jgi:uncharacterized protein (TIGR02265 family)
VTEKLVFSNAMESLLRVMGQPLPPEQLSALVARGVDPSRPLLPAYPMDVYTAVIDYIVSQRWPRLYPDDGCYELGRAFMEAYTTKTLRGKALRSMAWTVGPRRILQRMNINFRSANNYTETRLQQVGPGAYELWFNYAARPGYFRGILSAGLEMAGAKGLQVELGSRRGDEASFRITWVE